MSRILLVNLSSLPMPGNEPIFPIGVHCIQQALEQAGHTARLIDFVEHPEAVYELSWASEEWDVIGFSIRNIDPIDLACDGHVDAYSAFVKKIKALVKENVVLVGGGPGYSLFADNLTELLGLHVGVRGPGEEIMLEIAADPQKFAARRQVIDGKRYEGFVSKVLKYPENLMHVYASGTKSMIGVETRRKTCFQRCIYCPYAYITGESSGDVKPLDILMEEISGIYNAGFRRIFFTDGIFNSGIAYAKQVVRMLSEKSWPGLTWSAYFAAQPFDDEFASLLKKSGVENIVVSPDSLDNDLMQRLGKNFDLAAMNRFVDTCRRHGLKMMVNVVFGGPGENRKTAENTANYINRVLEEDELSLHVGFRILPHTSLSKETGLKESELIYPTFYPFDNDLFQWMLKSLDSKFMTPARLMNLLAGRSSARRMGKVINQHDDSIGDGGTHVIAIRRIGSKSDSVIGGV
ncbi:B12-binding domain-containing radical SAM protein [Chromobacterium amazonense]|uniref:Radical SAM protein n=1 Tax=Chromobacterium amazonense TaxID=1382803 RepID=A0ABU8V4T4_9NEIS|nr:radical SAM protein [Chromobacterium amazonense]MDQ4540679.1 radical SAM protein [Chromobacterium amazonense]